MGNPKKDVETISVRVDSETMAAVRRLLRDPVRNKTQHGEVSKLINNLLKQHVAKVRTNSLEGI